MHVRVGPFDFGWLGGGGGCRSFRLLDIFFVAPALRDFFLISLSLHDIFFKRNFKKFSNSRPKYLTLRLCF